MVWPLRATAMALATERSGASAVPSDASEPEGATRSAPAGTAYLVLPTGADPGDAPVVCRAGSSRAAASPRRATVAMTAVTVRPRRARPAASARAVETRLGTDTSAELQLLHRTIGAPGAPGR